MFVFLCVHNNLKWDVREGSKSIVSAFKGFINSLGIKTHRYKKIALVQIVWSGKNHMNAWHTESNRVAWRSREGFVEVSMVLVLKKILYAHKHLGNRIRRREWKRKREMEEETEGDTVYLPCSRLYFPCFIDFSHLSMGQIRGKCIFI